MRILFDQGVPAPLRRELTNHDIVTAYEVGWHELRNGDLLAAAQSAGFDVLVTTDRNIINQQNLSTVSLAVVTL
jgi:predicted nuclease of predicted toxin-antitoxin system